MFGGLIFFTFGTTEQALNCEVAAGQTQFAHHEHLQQNSDSISVTHQGIGDSLHDTLNGPHPGLSEGIFTAQI